MLTPSQYHVKRKVGLFPCKMRRNMLERKRFHGLFHAQGDFRP
jgi:hypothetical protein